MTDLLRHQPNVRPQRDAVANRRPMEATQWAASQFGRQCRNMWPVLVHGAQNAVVKLVYHGAEDPTETRGTVEGKRVLERRGRGMKVM